MRTLASCSASSPAAPVGALLPFPFEGVHSAIGAFAVSDNCKTAYFHDPQPDLIYAVNLQTGNKKVLKWEDREFHHRRYVCYTLFYLRKHQEDYLSMLFFNRHKKAFCLIHFWISGELLIKHQTTMLNTTSIAGDRLAYTVQKIGNEIQMIFYERFSRSHPESEENPSLHFVCCILNCTTMRVSQRAGLLPQGQWELPFIHSGKLYVVCTARSPNMIAGLQLDSEETSWDARAISATHDDLTPPRKAMWCNAWARDGCYFSVTEKVESRVEGEQTVRRTAIWHLDPAEAIWTKLLCKVDLLESSANFAFRIASETTGFLHMDTKPREAAIYKVKLTDAMSEARRVASAADEGNWVDPQQEDCGDTMMNPSSSREALYDLICPVCLDTYDDARNLNCGHSMCWACIEQMRMIAKTETIACPACRKMTKIPEGGLPVNYGLNDAVATLNRLLESKKNGIRCANCRERCEEKKLWACLTCIREGNKKRKRESTMMYIGNINADSFDENSATPPQSEQKKSEETEKTDYFSENSFCAGCLLYYHKSHEYEELVALSERDKVVSKQKEQWQKTTSETVEKLKEAVRKVSDQALDQVILQNVHLKVEEICDVVTNSSDEIDERGMAVLTKLDSIRNTFLEKFESMFHEFLEDASADSHRAESESSQEEHHEEASFSGTHGDPSSRLDRQDSTKLECWQEARASAVSVGRPSDFGRVPAQVASSIRSSASSHLSSPVNTPPTPPLPLTLPPLDREPTVRRPAILRMNRVPHEHINGQLSDPDISPVRRLSPMNLPTLSQALQYSNERKRTITSEL